MHTDIFQNQLVIMTRWAHYTCQKSSILPQSSYVCAITYLVTSCAINSDVIVELNKIIVVWWTSHIYLTHSTITPLNGNIGLLRFCMWIAYTELYIPHTCPVLPQVVPRSLKYLECLRIVCVHVYTQGS